MMNVAIGASNMSFMDSAATGILVLSTEQWFGVLSRGACNEHALERKRTDYCLTSFATELIFVLTAVPKACNK
jgi:hypothetical protein